MIIKKIAYYCSGVIFLKSTAELERVFEYYKRDLMLKSVVRSELVNSGSISIRDLNIMFSPNTQIEQCNPAVVALIYKTIYKYRDSAADKNLGLRPPEYYFERNELDEALMLTATQSLDEYPITFYDVTQLSPHEEYCFCLTLSQLQELTSRKLLRIRADMQRESEILTYSAYKIPCIKYDEHKAREIADGFLSGQQHPNMLRFHLIPDNSSPEISYVYDSATNSITINNGLLANIDGNHRIGGIELAMYENASIGNQYKMVVILSVGIADIARDIIVQEEKRLPINTQHVLSFKQTNGNRIVSELKLTSGANRYFKFCTTIEQSNAGGGYFVESLLADAITRSFNLPDKMLPRQIKRLVSYLSEFLETYYIFMDSLMPGCLDDYYKHLDLIICEPHMVYGLMEIASKFYNDDNDNWEEDLYDFLQRLNLKQKRKAVYKINLDLQAIRFVRGNDDEAFIREG